MGARTETHTVTCVYMESGDRVEWPVNVTLPEGSPFTDFSDAAWDIVYSRFPFAEFVDEL